MRKTFFAYALKKRQQIKMAFSIPDYMFNSIYEITPEFLKNSEIYGLLCDIDNTLVTYDDPKPTPTVLSWLHNMSRNGIKIAFVSNNVKERVDLFNDDLKYPAFAKSKKPLSSSTKKAVVALGIDKKHLATLGDQIFTDVWAGNFLGIRTIIVPPIKDKTNLFFRCKRFLEKPFIYAYKRKNKN